jgi:two-component system response regulator FixJ
VPTLIHIVDDDSAVRDSLGVLLQVEGLDVRLYASGQDLLAALPIDEGGCVVTDFHMPRMDGLELVRRLKAAGSALPVLVITGGADRAMAAEAIRQGAHGLVEKPFGPAEFVAAVRGALRD